MFNSLSLGRLLLAAGIVLAMSFRPEARPVEVPTTVAGNVQPIDGALHAWLYSATDTVSCNVDNTTGRFEFPSVKPGNYQLFVEGRPPYRNSVKDGIQVADGRPNDVGVIQMQK